MRDRLAAMLRGNRRELYSAVFWSLPLRLFGMGATFLLGVLLARYLGAEELGVYGMVLASVLLGSVLVQAGLPLLATRELAGAEARQEWGLLRGLIRGPALLVAGLAGAAAGATALVLLLFDPPLEPNMRSAIAWGLPLLPLLALLTMVSAQLRGLHALLRGQALDLLVRPLILALLVIALFALRQSLDGAEALALHGLATLAALALGAWWLVRAIPPAARHVRPVVTVRAWTRAALPLGAVDVLRQLEGTYTILLVGLIGTAADAGVFRVAVSAAVLVGLPNAMLYVVLAPAVSRYHALGDRRSLQLILGGAALGMVGATLGLTALVWLVGEPLILLLFGEEYRAAFYPLLLLSAVQLVYALFGVGAMLLVNAHEAGAVSRFYAIAVAIGAAAAFPLISQFGASGAAMALIVSTLINGLLTWRHARRALDLDPSLLGSGAFLREELLRRP